MAARRHIVGVAGVPCGAQSATTGMPGTEVRLR
jgi:hypothetical protein